MSMLLPRSYSTGSKSKIRESPDQANIELAPAEDMSEPLFKSVEVQVQASEEEPGEAPKSEHDDPPGNEKAISSEAPAEPPLDPDAKYEKNLKKAQEEWARRRKAGYEDYGEEMSKDAKVWQVYVRETDKADEELVDGWNKFVGISAQSLQQNPADTSAQTLLVISQTLLAISGGGATNSTSSGPGEESAGFRPSGRAVAVNALWFLSLSLSVAVSLIAMLAKEWCYSFMASRTGETYERARLRQHRWNEIERLRMIDVLTLLPLLMHLTLLLFAVGLCIYLWDINIIVAIPVIAITAISTVVYTSTVVHSLTTEHCPYTTASSKLAKSYVKAWLNSPASFLNSWIKLSVERLSSWAIGIAQRIDAFSTFTVKFRSFTAYLSAHLRPRPWMKQPAAYVTSQIRIPSTLFTRFFHAKAINAPVMGRETQFEPDPRMDITTSHMLSWLLTNCNDSKTIELVVCSLAGAEPWLPRLPLLESDALSTLFLCLNKCFEFNYRIDTYSLKPGISPDTASLCLRALQYLLGYHNSCGFFLHHTGSKNVMKSTWARDYYPRDLAGMAVGIEADGHNLRVESLSSSPDIITHWRNSLMIFNERDPEPRYHDLPQDESNALITAHLRCDTVLHPAMLVAMVRQLTNRLCLPIRMWEDHPDVPRQLCFLLLRLYLHSEHHEKNQDLQFAITVAIAAAVLSFGSFPGWTHPPGSTSSSRAQEFVMYHNLPRSIIYSGLRASTTRTRDLEIQRLLEFGLLGLLELPLAHQLTEEDLKTWVTVFNQIHDVYMYYVPVHSLPQTFTYGVHAARVLTQYMSTSPLNGDSVPHAAGWDNCFLALCNWNLTAWSDETDDHRAVHHILLEFLSSADSPGQQRRCALLLGESTIGCSKSCLESLPSGTLSKLLATSLSGHRFAAPTAMHELWNLSESMIPLAEESPAIESLLRSLIPPDASLPKTPDELGLLQQWFPHLHTMCVESPQELLDSKILLYTRWYYWHDHGTAQVVWPFNHQDGPGSITGSEVANILEELENKCKSAVAERQRWQELPFGEDAEEADS
ncbi:hypothetical protein FRC07_011726 [Ceratobasidium sp. 392]|nr:hypothetical protein FRC07_011726 [Ceratobasidium sp. 392]